MERIPSPLPVQEGHQPISHLAGGESPSQVGGHRPLRHHAANRPLHPPGGVGMPQVLQEEDHTGHRTQGIGHTLTGGCPERNRGPARKRRSGSRDARWRRPPAQPFRSPPPPNRRESRKEVGVTKHLVVLGAPGPVPWPWHPQGSSVRISGWLPANSSATRPERPPPESPAAASALACPPGSPGYVSTSPPRAVERGPDDPLHPLPGVHILLGWPTFGPGSPPEFPPCSLDSLGCFPGRFLHPHRAILHIPEGGEMGCQELRWGR